MRRSLLKQSKASGQTRAILRTVSTKMEREGKGEDIKYQNRRLLEMVYMETGLESTVIVVFLNIFFCLNKRAGDDPRISSPTLTSPPVTKPTTPYLYMPLLGQQ